MKELAFKIRCRSCKNCSNLNTIMFVNEEDFEWWDGRFQYSNMLKSEYEFGKTIRRYLRESNQPCEYCGSYNLHIFDIKYDRERAYIFDTSGLNDELEMKIPKVGTKISVKVAPFHPVNFIIEAVNHILGQINMFIEDEDFEEDTIGYMNFIVSKKFEKNRTIARIEQFDHSGYSREEALSVLNYIKLNAETFVD